MMAKLKKIFEFLYYIIGNIIQIFIVVVFVDFLCHRFKEWMIDFYVATNCNYQTIDSMFVILLVSAILIIALGIARYIWFRFRYLKRNKQLKRKSKINEKNYELFSTKLALDFYCFMFNCYCYFWMYRIQRLSSATAC